MTKKAKKTAKTETANTNNFNLPKTPATWEKVETIKLTAEQQKAVESLPELKGFELWLAPFKTPDKAFRVAAKAGFAVIHIVTWDRKFIAKLGKTKALNMAELA